MVDVYYLEDDDDGIYGSDPNPNIVDGTVDSRGRIIDPNYDFNTLEPLKNSAGLYLFQSSSPAPTINIPPQSTIACYSGAPAEFEVTLDPIPNPIFQWQLSTDGGVTWTDLTNDSTYSGVDTRKLTISSTTTAMKDYQYKVIFSTDEYACLNESDGLSKLDVIPSLPIINPAPIIELCDDTSSSGGDTDQVNIGIDLTIHESTILGTQSNLDFTYHLSLASAADINDSDGLGLSSSSFPMVMTLVQG